MFVSKQVIQRLRAQKASLKEQLEHLKRAAQRGDNQAVRAGAEHLELRINSHADLVDAVIEAVTEDVVDEEP